MRTILSTFGFFVFASCLPALSYERAKTEVPFEYVAGHILVVPAQICGRKSFVILDTGVGVNVISKTLARKLGCRESGQHSGRRMSGQKMTMATTSIPSLQIGDCIGTNIPTAMMDLDKLFPNEPEFNRIEGFISLNFFRNTPFTLDYRRKQLIIEDHASVGKRLLAGSAVPVYVQDKHGIETGITLPLKFSNGQSALVEVDTGSGNLILDQKYMKSFGIALDSPNLKIVRGKDETGHAYVRYFGTLPARVSLSAAKNVQQSNPRVQFQKIIYDGLIGDSFLHNFVVTYDLPNRRMIFGPN
jgi:hypothetical protein